MNETSNRLYQFKLLFYKGVADTKTALKTYENIAEDIITNDKVILDAILIKYFLNKLRPIK